MSIIILCEASQNDGFGNMDIKILVISFGVKEESAKILKQVDNKYLGLCVPGLKFLNCAIKAPKQP
jgi:hypothetical protein